MMVTQPEPDVQEPLPADECLGDPGFRVPTDLLEAFDETLTSCKSRGTALQPPGEPAPPPGGYQLLPTEAQQGARGFPNPWLWPTDAAVGGSGLATHPHDVPMKILIFAQQSALRQDSERTECPPPKAAPAPKEPVRGQELAAEVKSQEPSDEFSQCRWHKSAETVGIISSNGHVFTKTAGPRRSRVSDRGAKVELASICMVFDSSLRCGGVHRYCYQIMEGELGAADGAGFVFDSKVRRNNIQRMRSVFLNQRGRICLRNNQQVTKLQVQLPPLTVGVCLTLLIDLDALMARFNVTNSHGVLNGSADVSLNGLFNFGLGSVQLRSGSLPVGGHAAPRSVAPTGHLPRGTPPPAAAPDSALPWFFCAVVTGNITIGIH